MCSSAPNVILETVYLETGLQAPDLDGKIEFDDSRGCEVMWDSLTPAVVHGKVTLRCVAHHEWLAQVE
jgi:hypothetical protein